MKQESLSLDQFIARASCKKYAEIAKLGIRMEEKGQQKRNMLEKALKMQGSIIGDQDAPDKMEQFVRENLKPDWYLVNSQYAIQLQEEVFYQRRLASVFQSEIRKASNVVFQIPGEKTEFFKGMLSGVAHAILQQGNGGFKAVIFKPGVSPYSRTARKMENRPEYAPEILAAYLGLYQTYGRNLRVEFVYLKHEKDGTNDLFDCRKQIMPADLSSVEVPELWKRLQEMMDVHVRKREKENECDKCKYVSLCRGERKKEEAAEEYKPASPVFTEPQKCVVHFKEGACAVYAVPGAGKTTALVYRLCELLKNGVDPSSILFVTFTNKAASEIKERVKAILGTNEEAELPDIYTYNGLGWQIIRDHPEVYGQKKLLNPTDERLLLLKCLDEFPRLAGYSYSYIEGRFGLLNQLKRSFVSMDKDEEAETEELIRKGHNADQVKAVYDRLHQLIKAEGYITYDEQITLANRILAEHPDILNQYAAKWEYIMADEFQDSSQDNVDLLYRIARAGKSNIVVVGDADQSIFEWRNGSPKHLLRFGNSFPGAKKILMQDNFRSSEKILDASNRLIAQNADRIAVSMQAHKPGSALPYRLKGADINTVPAILRMLREKRFSFGDIAILSRKNAPLEKCRQLLEKIGIESVSPSDKLLKDPFFLLVRDLLKLFEDLNSDMPFYRIFKALGCELPPKEDRARSFYENLVFAERLAPLDIYSMESALEYAVDDQDRQKTEIYLAAKVLFKVLTEMKGAKPEKILDLAAERFGYASSDPALIALSSVVEHHEPMETLEDLKHYMDIMEQLGDETMVEYNPTPEKVNLMTAHGAKGKEFPAVIVLQCEDFHADEEERRLMYVAMTRAKKVLFLLESPCATCELFDSIDVTLQTMALAV